MQKMLEPLKVRSLKEACINRLEELIISGELKIGERLPAERDFAVTFFGGIGRLIVFMRQVNSSSLWI